MKQLSRGFEDYLEAILICEKKYGKVKAIKLAEFLEISRPAASKMLKVLESEAFIERYENYIEFTSIGRQIAEKVYKKHLIVKEFLIKLGVNCEVAEKDCCKIEHCISDETFNAITNFVITDNKR